MLSQTAQLNVTTGLRSSRRLSYGEVLLGRRKPTLILSVLSTSVDVYHRHHLTSVSCPPGRRSPSNCAPIQSTIISIVLERHLTSVSHPHCRRPPRITSLSDPLQFFFTTVFSGRSISCHRPLRSRTSPAGQSISTSIRHDRRVEDVPFTRYSVLAAAIPSTSCISVRRLSGVIDVERSEAERTERSICPAYLTDQSPPDAIHPKSPMFDEVKLRWTSRRRSSLTPPSDPRRSPSSTNVGRLNFFLYKINRFPDPQNGIPSSV